MDAMWIITVFVVIDDLMTHLEHHTHPLADVPDAEILTVAVVAAKYFHNHHARALDVLIQCGYLSGQISPSRFNRRLHALADWVPFIAETLGDLLTYGDVFVIDSTPLPVCHRARARRCRKVRGRVFCGYCAAKKEKFFGWRLHLICTPDGIPVRFTMLPGALHDLTPIHELTADLPPTARVYGDKAFNSATDHATILAETGVRIVARRRANMQPNHWLDDLLLREYRHTIETVNSQLEAMGTQRLRARTNTGFALKVHASLIAVMCA